MSDMVGTVLPQKPRRLQRFRNESSFARYDAEQRPERGRIASVCLPDFFFGGGEGRTGLKEKCSVITNG